MSYQIDVLCTPQDVHELALPYLISNVEFDYTKSSHTYRVWFHCPSKKSYVSCNIKFSFEYAPDEWTNAVIAMVNRNNAGFAVDLQQQWRKHSKWQKLVNDTYHKTAPIVPFVLSIDKPQPLKQLGIPCIRFCHTTATKVLTQLMTDIYGHKVFLVM